MQFTGAALSLRWCNSSRCENHNGELRRPLATNKLYINGERECSWTAIDPKLDAAHTVVRGHALQITFAAFPLSTALPCPAPDYFLARDVVQQITEYLCRLFCVPAALTCHTGPVGEDRPAEPVSVCLPTVARSSTCWQRGSNSLERFECGRSCISAVLARLLSARQRGATGSSSLLVLFLFCLVLVPHVPSLVARPEWFSNPNDHLLACPRPKPSFDTAMDDSDGGLGPQTARVLCVLSRGPARVPSFTSAAFELNLHPLADRVFGP